MAAIRKDANVRNSGYCGRNGILDRPYRLGRWYRCVLLTQVLTPESCIEVELTRAIVAPEHKRTIKREPLAR